MIPINPRNLIFGQLLFQLNSNFDQQRLQINQSLRKAVDRIFEKRSQLNLQIPNQELEKIQEELTLFLFAFTKAPSIWVQLLRNDQISTETSKIIINKSQTITKIYEEIIEQTNELIKQSRAKTKGIKTPDHQTQENVVKLSPFDFEKQYVDKMDLNLLSDLLNSLALEICKFYSAGKKLILQQEKNIQDKLRDSQIMNPYYLFGMLKQMSSYTFLKLQQSMSQSFNNLTKQTIQKFCRYVQKNYEFVQLGCSQQLPRILNQKELIQQINLQNEFWLNFLCSMQDNECTLKKVLSSKGDSAFMIIKNKNEQEKKEQTINEEQNLQAFSDAEKLIVKIGQDNRIRVTNSRASQKKWQVFNIKDSVSNLYSIVKKQIKGSAGGAIQKQITAYGVPLGQYSNIGGSLGRCLADINKYKSANHFFKDLSKSTIVGGSMSYILAQIPILSYFIVAGGLTYTFYFTFRNKATSMKKKWKQIGKASITAVGSFGSAVAGMVIGQTVIPVPFLGAFVGGVVGGFLGQTGGNLMTKLMNKQSYKNLINYLKQTREPGNYWKYTPQLLQKLGISKQYFEQTLTKNKKGNKDAYITAICFCVVSSYESKNYAARNQKKMKQLQKNKKTESQLLKQQQDVETEFDIVGIINYLTSQNIVLLHEHDQLQKCIRHLNI